MECLECYDPICDACGEHAIPGAGYQAHEGETLCGHCYLDATEPEARRHDACGGVVLNSTCACYTPVRSARDFCYGRPKED